MAEAALRLEQAGYRRSALVEWLTTVDHKKIGILYYWTSIVYLLLAGFLALLMRIQLAQPDMNFLGPKTYNEVMTMHGTMMIFAVAMPLNAAFFNIAVPLMIGARDVAFPRLNAFSYWSFLFGSLLMWSSFLFGHAPDAGWFGYANLSSSRLYSAGPGLDFWDLGLQVLGISSIAGALNFFVTIVNMRAPGMSLMRMPVYVWMVLVTAVLILLAFPSLTVGLFMIMFDRYFDTNFFNPLHGGDPVIWQHLFWIFGHPEVYILVLPPMGIISEILPTFSRKPLFGAPFVIFAGIAIAFLSFFVWAHHMFTVGLGPVPNALFAASTMMIGIPTGVKVFNWLATMWGGSIDFKAPMKFASAAVWLLMMGGVTGVMHATVPLDYQQQDSYFIVAHFHYIIFGVIVMALLGATYYWFPKMYGRLLDERLGTVHFWLTFLAMNLTFFPMHFVGLDGMPRRYFTYSAETGWGTWNLVITIGAFILGLSQLVLLVNVVKTMRQPANAPADPWDGRTLEWTIPSPPPAYNFAVIPTVRGRDAYWIEKYGDGHHTVTDTTQRRHVSVNRDNPGHGLPAGVHLPKPSWWPMIVSAGLTAMAAGMIMHGTETLGPLGFPVVGIGAFVVFFGLLGWHFEPAIEHAEHEQAHVHH
ncbi:MAG: cytochrome c oxidase subunit I [Thermomicrobium sp.]|nr:cytochrome c oxidase subunit I [Thermomicrobium sp.]MDW8059262.1 cytochrome c oxidase subunit I [Thermomicrobium sp.]